MPKGGSKTKIPSVFSKQYNATDFFAGLDTAEDHLQDTPTVKTFDVVVANDDASKRITVHEVTVACTPSNTAVTPFIGTLAEEDATDDLLVFCPNRLWTFKYSTPFRLAPAKDLIHYHVQAAGTGTNTSNSLQILYTVDDN